MTPQAVFFLGATNNNKMVLDDFVEIAVSEGAISDPDRLERRQRAEIMVPFQIATIASEAVDGNLDLDQRFRRVEFTKDLLALGIARGFFPVIAERTEEGSDTRRIVEQITPKLIAYQEMLNGYVRGQYDNSG